LNKKETTKQARKSKNGLPFRWEWLILIIVLLVVVMIRIRLLDIPLERDEGEYAYAGQLILQGVVPFQEVRMPGVYGVYAFIMAIFGETPAGIHTGLLFFNMGAVGFLVLLGKKLFNLMAGVAAGAGFAVLSLSQSVQGVFAQNEHFVILPVLLGLWVLLKAASADRRYAYLLSGLFLGVAFLMKQHGAAFILFGGFYLTYMLLRRRPISWRHFVSRSVTFYAGAVIPSAALCVFHILFGDFHKFWFWTFTYAREYVTSQTLEAGLDLLRDRLASMAHSAILLWCLGGIGFTSMFWDRRIHPYSIFVGGFFFFSFLSVCPGFYFRPHYFVLIIPSIALFIGLGVSSIRRFLSGFLPHLIATGVSVSILVVAVSYCFYKERSFFFHQSPSAACRAIYGANPFPESITIGKYIRDHSSPEDRIAVIGSEPQIYFYSRRRSATEQVNTYELMELHPYALKLQLQMISDIEAAQPKFLVFVNIETSWLKRAGSEPLIFEWFVRYVEKYYKPVGLVDIISAGKTDYYWGESAAWFSPRSRYWLGIYERNR